MPSVFFPLLYIILHEVSILQFVYCDFWLRCLFFFFFFRGGGVCVYLCGISTCVCMFTYIHACVYICIHAREGQRVISAVFYNQCTSCVFGQNLSVNLETANLASVANQLALRSSCFHTSKLNDTPTCHLHGCWGLEL